MPKWDMVPTLLESGKVLIPEQPDQEWCDMVNQIYGISEYRVHLLAYCYKIAAIIEEGQSPTDVYQLRVFADKHGNPDGHYITGVFESIEMRPDINLSNYKDQNHKIPFVKLSCAVDTDDSRKITEEKQHVYVPTTHVQELYLDY